MRSVSHYFAHIGFHRIGVDDVFDRVAPVIEVSGFEGPLRAKGALTGHCSEREVGHTRQPFEAYTRQRVEPMRGRIEEGTKDVRSCQLEFPPKRVLRPTLMLGNRRKHQQDGAVGKIGRVMISSMPLRMTPGGRKQNFVLIGEQPTCRKGTSARKTAEGIRQQGDRPLRLSKARTWPLLAAMNNSRSSRGRARTGATLGSIIDRRIFERYDLG